MWDTNSMEGAVARRVQYAEATRRGLMEAAQELFASEGYVDVSIDEICRRARVTKGALYHHFRDKRDLFTAVRSEEHTSELQSQSNLVCRLLLEKKKKTT